MKKIYLIQYKGSDADQIEARIKSVGTWLKYFGDNFLVETTKTAKDIYAEISVGFEEDSIFIIEINPKIYYGRMNTKVWDWLKAR